MANVTQALGVDIAHVRGDLVRASNGDQGTIRGLPNLKVALFHRLMTVPGTLVHRPTYGVGVMLYQNSLNSFSMQQKLAAKIQDQFSLDPRVQSVTSVSIDFTDQNPQLSIIRVFVVPIGYTDAQEMTFMPFSGDT